MAFMTTDWSFMGKLDPTQKLKLRELIEELKSLNFVEGSQLSKYIVQSKIAEDKYRMLGADLIASNERIDPRFGGFSKEIFSYLCTRLGLQESETDFKIISEIPYSENLK